MSTTTARNAPISAQPDPFILHPSPTHAQAQVAKGFCTSLSGLQDGHQNGMRTIIVSAKESYQNRHQAAQLRLTAQEVDIGALKKRLDEEDRVLLEHQAYS